MTDSNNLNEILIDFEKVSQELRVRPEILKKLVVSFSKSMVEKMQRLKEALDTADVVTARSILHELKGTSGNLRLHKIYEAVDKLHVAVKAFESQDKVIQYFLELESQFQKFQEYISKFEQGGGS